MARGLKDQALASSLKAYLNRRFREYGQATVCAVDTVNRRIALTVLLRGERDAVTLTVERYELLRGTDTIYLVPYTITSSRAWLSLLIERLFNERRLRLPAAIAHLLG